MFNRLLDPQGYKLPRLAELGPQIGVEVQRLQALALPQLATEVSSGIRGDTMRGWARWLARGASGAALRRRIQGTVQRGDGDRCGGPDQHETRD